MADVLANKVIPSGDHDMPLSAVAHALQDLPHAQGNGGLARAGGTCEAHVKGRHSRVEAELATHLHRRTDHHERQVTSKRSASRSAVTFVVLYLRTRKQVQDR